MALVGSGDRGIARDGKDVVRAALVENRTDLLCWFVGVQHQTAAGVVGKHRERGLAEQIRALFRAPGGRAELRGVAQPFECARIDSVKRNVGLVERPRQPFPRRIDSAPQWPVGSVDAMAMSLPTNTIDLWRIRDPDSSVASAVSASGTQMPQ